MTNVLIVDDERITQELFAYYISQASDRYRLAGTIRGAANAELYCANGNVGLVLMDICSANGESGIEAAAAIKKHYPEIKVIMVTSAPDFLFIQKSKRAGADSFWYKEVGALELIEVMDKTMAGESVWPDSTPHVQIGLASSEEFTPREIEVLYCIVQGKSVGEIADTLFIDYTTAKWHIKNLKEKVGARSIAELAVMAARTRLVMPEY